MRCDQCMWYDQMPNQPVGLCRRVAPVVIPAELEDPQADGRLTKPFTTWPVVRKHDWCGMYEPAS